MERTLLITTDDSTILHLPEWKKNYDSSHGIIQESKYIFIRHGLDMFKDVKWLSILEVGYGTSFEAFPDFIRLRDAKYRLHCHREISDPSNRIANVELSLIFQSGNLQSGVQVVF